MEGAPIFLQTPMNHSRHQQIRIQILRGFDVGQPFVGKERLILYHFPNHFADCLNCRVVLRGEQKFSECLPDLAQIIFLERARRRVERRQSQHGIKNFFVRGHENFGLDQKICLREFLGNFLRVIDTNKDKMIFRRRANNFRAATLQTVFKGAGVVDNLFGIILVSFAIRFGKSNRERGEDIFFQRGVPRVDNFLVEGRGKFFLAENNSRLRTVQGVIGGEGQHVGKFHGRRNFFRGD